MSCDYEVEVFHIDFDDGEKMTVGEFYVRDMEAHMESNAQPQYGGDGRIQGHFGGPPMMTVKLALMASGEDIDQLHSLLNRIRHTGKLKLVLDD